MRPTGTRAEAARALRRAPAVLLLAALFARAAAPAADGPRYDPTTLVYPTFQHDLGFHHVGDFQLRLFTGNRHRFRVPRGIAAVKLVQCDRPDRENDDDELTVFGVNSGENCVIYNTSQTTLASYGERGSGPGHFLHPWGIAAHPAGDVYVADTGNDRIVHLRYRQDRLREVKSLHVAKGDTLPFRSPRGVAIATCGDVYVADTGNDRIVVFDRAGRLVRTIGGAGRFRGPEGIALLDREERWSYRRDAFLVVIDRNGRRVVTLDLDGKGRRETTGAALGTPGARFRGAAIDYYHQIYLTDEANDRIVKLDSRLRPIVFFGREGGGDKEFRDPFGIAVWRRFGQFFISERKGAQYYWVGVDLLGYHGEPAVFRGGGQIVVTFTERARATIRISDLHGRTLRTLRENRVFGPGEMRIRWNGRDDDGRALPAGRYRVTIEARATYSSSKHFQKSVAFLVTLG